MASFNQPHRPQQQDQPPALVMSAILVFMFLFIGGFIFANSTWLEPATSDAADVSDANSVEVAALPTEIAPTVVPPTLVPPTAVPTVVPTTAPVAMVDASTAQTFAFDPALAAQGQQLFTLCAACHGADARGLPNLGKDLVASEFVHSLTDQELLDFVKVGRPVWDPANTTFIDMPPRGGNPALTDDDLLAIIAYIRSLS